MKGFIFAAVTLLVLSAAVILNTVYIDHQTTELLRMLDSLPENPSRDDTVSLCEDFRERWSGFADRLLLTVDHKAIEDIEDTCATLIVHAKVGSPDPYLSDISLLREELTHLRKAELFSFMGIF